ncbi:MAG: DUF2157 domain-containing protein [Sulfurimonadaceae bacterium]|nr:DUF2157 domain-containing protein [Sulfurimonadaceae bacterium]
MAAQLSPQQRTDQIRAFQKELKLLEQENIVLFTEKEKIDTYHKNLLEKFISSHNVDTTQEEKQLTLGMKISSFLAVLALALCLFYLFFHYWGFFDEALQVVILITAPLLFLGVSFYLVQKEEMYYYAKISAMLSFVSFILNIVVIGEIFNLASSVNAFLIWSFYGVLLAYIFQARLLLGMGIIAFTFYLSAQVGVWGGGYWFSFSERPESFLFVAVILFSISFIKQQLFIGFDKVYRYFGMLLFFFPILILSNYGYASYILWDHKSIEELYQVMGFLMSALAIYFGIRKGYGEVVNIGNSFFVIFLYTKFFQWWWAWMPKYIFFFILGMSALVILIVLKKVKEIQYKQLKRVAL